MAVLEAICWECWGTHGGARDNMVGVLGADWQYWGQYRLSSLGCMVVLGCPSDPSNNSEGVRGHPLGPQTN